MSLTKLTTDLNIVSALADLPNATSGLTAAQLKAKFDEGSNDIKTYINDTLTPELDTQLADGSTALTTHKSSGDHDGRYYTETESDNLFETKSSITTNRKLSATGDFTGTLNGYPIVEADPGLSSTVAALKADVAIINLNRYSPTGNGVANDTAAFNSALADASGSGKTLKIPKPSVKYKIDPLVIPSNLNVEFEKGTIIEATTGYAVDQRMLSFDGASNVTWTCNGTVFQMLKAEYTTDERRHVFNLINCQNVTLIEPIAKDTGGDGYFIGLAANNITLIRPVSDNARRNGISITSATNVYIEKPVCRNTIGTSPESGIDIEPNSVADLIQNIKIVNPLCENNNQNGIQLYFIKYGLLSNAPDVTIDIINPVTRNNGKNGLSINRLESITHMNGVVNILNPLSENDGTSGILVQDKSTMFSYLNMVNPVVINPCRNKTTYPTDRGFVVARTNVPPSPGIGRMRITGISVQDYNANAVHGVTLMLGAAIETTIGVDSVNGGTSASVSIPVTQGEVISNSVKIDISNLRNEKIYVNAILGIFGNQFGDIITNESASANTIIEPREHLPIGHCFRFKVKSTWLLKIRPYSTDTILGLTAGQVYQSGILGSELELYYQGSGLWVPRFLSGTWTIA